MDYRKPSLVIHLYKWTNSQLNNEYVILQLMNTDDKKEKVA